MIPTRLSAEPVTPRPQMTVGDKVKFANTRHPWTVRAVTRAGRFAILTKPFNLRRTVLYTVVDFDRGVRGVDDHYGLGYETDDQITAALAMFQATEDDLARKAAEEARAAGLNSWPSVACADVSFRSGNHVRIDFQSINGEPCDSMGRRS